MRFDQNLMTRATLAELGTRVRGHRLERNITQGQLADEAGVSRATLSRLESGESVQLTSLIGLLRVLGLLNGLEVLVPEPVPNPIERLKTEGQRRKRARPSQLGEAAEITWTWGAELPAAPPPDPGREDESP